MTTRCIRCGSPIEGMGQLCDTCAEDDRGAAIRYQPLAPTPPVTAAPRPAHTQPDASGRCVCGQYIPMGAVFCAGCGRRVATGTVEYGGFWMRFVAALIDGVILFVAQVFVGLIVTDTAGRLAINLLIGFAYTVGFWTAEGATPGKMAMGLKITRTNAGDISPGQAIGRYLGEWVCVLTLGIGFLMIAFTPEKRGLHDYIAGTVVVKTR